ncbi:protein tyrosine phosphatase (PTP) superfamily phosphohydrolase (DUF442 family) [Acinetobacter calcoaceticus]|uniref:Protein tyrosine phosphatase (PTP) superfamily phosphohydrolase (DUF442 family) n=1 Tax=Acinetobacter calcoaceticus TaxID=471 RepID=A0A4V6NJ73_ACICA|nr:protein tyrosine phosphatase (PTP) superfamily phosphohydrolase (DUF442 family) [Acinetobacter calcoaceticus]
MNEIEQQLSEIPNFQFIHDRLLTSGQPSLQQLNLIKDYGVDSMIRLSLNDAQAELEQQDQHCLDIGLNYLHMPMLWDRPTADQALLVLDLIDYLVKDKMIWVYCDDNCRVSSLMYLYRQYYMGLDLPTAHELLHQIWEPNDTWTGVQHAVSLQLQGRISTQELQQDLAQIAPEDTSDLADPSDEHHDES